MWNVQSGDLRKGLVGSPEIGGIAFSGNGKLVGGVSGNEVRLWDVASATLKLELQIPGLDGGVRALAFSPDGRTMATGGKVDTGDNKNAKGEVRLWDLEGIQ
jgi:WD40 repeat protein